MLPTGMMTAEGTGDEDEVGFVDTAVTNSGNENDNREETGAQGVNGSAIETGDADEGGGDEEDGTDPVVVSAAAAGKGIKRRQYKKDTIYLYDLYTLTYDNNEQVESIETFNTIENENVSLRWGNVYYYYNIICRAGLYVVESNWTNAFMERNIGVGSNHVQC